jgi:hypothetical protein
MTKHLLAGVAAVVLMSGVASAQVYPPAPPPAYPPAPPPPYPVAPQPPYPVAPQPPAIIPPAPAPDSTTTTVAPTPEGGYRSSTTTKGVDINGNQVTKKDVYKEGVEGSTETHTKTQTNPLGETTTRSTTTTGPH